MAPTERATGADALTYFTEFVGDSSTMTTTLFGPPLDPKNNPYADPNFFDLSFNPSLPDDVQLTPGLLAGYAGGLRALDGNDTVRGASDSELVNGNSGKDVLSGGEGADFLQGGQDNDRVYGDSGGDSLNGNRGKDLVDGGAGNDFLRGGRDDDLLIGAQGNDTLIGDLGKDVLTGGSDSDIFVLRADAASANSNETDIIIDFDKVNDRIGLTGGLSEANITLETFTLSVRDELREELKRLKLSDSDVESLTPQLLDYFKSYPNSQTGLPGTVEQYFLGEMSANVPEMLAVVSGYIRYQDIDPNGDGLIEGTDIKLNGNSLGAVLNTTAADVSGHFISF